MKIFNGRPFFSVFFIARANQKIRSLALGRGSMYRVPEISLVAENVNSDVGRTESIAGGRDGGGDARVVVVVTRGCRL
jgi:hypothetical protein